ncbi:MAG: hypothetical protein HRU19_10150 [Pseudobacteriovorax sp.]|nr:hypothetical protein [Pseudobacteriovorax sp.]
MKHQDDILWLNQLRQNLLCYQKSTTPHVKPIATSKSTLLRDMKSS